MTQPDAAAPLEVVQLPVDALEPNPWNPNRMDEETRAKLTAYLRHRGLLQPLVVRPLSKGRKPRYQILGGFHRWQICREDLGYATVPCVVAELNDRDAKVLTVNLNELSGEPAPHLLAELIHDLNRDVTLDDLATQLPYSERQLADSLELLKVPDGLALQLEAEVKAHRDGQPTLLSFMVDEAEPVEQALAQVGAGLDGKNRRGRALTAVCLAYLEAHPPEEPPADADASA